MSGCWSTGRQCKNHVWEGSDAYCWIHDPDRRLADPAIQVKFQATMKELMGHGNDE